jgi:DNA-binding CsgD family transcriptional regulator
VTPAESVVLSHRLPRTVGAAAEAVVGARGDTRKLKRLFNQSPVPMVMLDGQRQYVEVNCPARLVFRLSLEEMRAYRLDDLTPAHGRPTIDAGWARMLDTGCMAGPSQVAGPDGSHFDVVYCGLANVLPGLHLLAFAPAGWPEDELSLLKESPADPVAPLTPREREVLQLAAEGLSGPGIAERLYVSPGTVKSHFQNIYAKLGVRDRAAAVARGLRLAFID